MSKDEKNNDKLDKNSRKRLEELLGEWAKPPASGCAITAFDLRLLLEHFSPLQDLIRSIAASSQDTAPTSPSVQAQPPIELQQAHNGYSNSELQYQAVQRDLAKCNASVTKLQQEKEKLLQRNKALKQEHKQLEKQLQQAQEQLSVCKAAQINTAPEVALLRSDPDLAQRLGLPDLPSDDTQALIQTVAILAQRDNLERLWSALKDRCEANNRPTSASERGLLETALAWHNHNWRTRPYGLIEAAPSNAYHFETHLRCRHTPVGETVAALHLPGIADGSGNPLCKALVRTR